MWQTSYLTVAQSLDFPDNAWFFLSIKQAGVVILRQRMIPQRVDGRIYAYKLGNPRVAFSRKYQKPGQVMLRQMNVIADANEYLGIHVDAELLAQGWRKSDQTMFDGDILYVMPGE